jgi:hypothetical protein
VNAALTKATGYQLTRAPEAPRTHDRGNRLVNSPVFLLAPTRSGSTLLRVILDTHSQICAPHELHLQTLHVSISPDFGNLAMRPLGMNERRLEHLLWDRLLDRELAASGKKIIVDKTPNNLWIWERLPEAWPKARYLFLIRHPGSIYNSLMRVGTRGGTGESKRSPDEAVARVVKYVELMEAARAGLSGLTVRYEDVTTDPPAATQRICEFLHVPWEASMLDYGAVDHGPYRAKLGDWGDKIKSGKVNSDIVIPTPEEVPAGLHDACRTWGYLP